MQTSPGHALVTLPNALSALRVLLAPGLAWSLLAGAQLTAAILFTLAVASDVLDGHLARRRRQTSPVGTVIDHGADAFFVTVANAACAAAGLVPALLPVLIPIAFLQYCIDSRAPAAGPPRRSRLGRWNGIGYYVAAAGGIVVIGTPLDAAPALICAAFGWLLVASTLASMASRATHGVGRQHDAP